MRRFLSFTLLAGIAVGANAQSFTDGFEGAVFGGGTNASGNTVGGDDITSVVTWRAINNSAPVGATGWFNGAVFPANTGTGQVSANFNSTTGANAIDNWLLSPTRTFNNGDTISFFTRTVTTPAFPDRLILKMSTAGASSVLTNFTTTLTTVNGGLTVAGYPNVWTQFTATITGLGGPTSGRFAFNYNVPNAGPSGANSDFIGIDDVVYTAAPVPEPATLTALALGGLALLRRRKKA